MKNSMLFIMLLLLTGQVAFGQKKHHKKEVDESTATSATPKLTKDEQKQLKAELKAYGKNLPAYKAKMDEVRNTLDSNAAQIQGLKSDTAVAGSIVAELENKVFAYETQITNLRTENDSLKTTVASTAAATVAVLGPEKGTVYKVQLGMYKALNLTKYFTEPRYVGYEEVDGMNRYVIGYFPDEETAKNFVADIRKLGIRDAFVSKYIDGARVYEWDNNPKYKGKRVPTSLNEALEMQQKGKK